VSVTVRTRAAVPAGVVGIERMRSNGPRGDDTHRRARNGTHRNNQPGSRAKCSRNKSNRCSRAFQHLLFDHGLEYPAGTPAAFVRATARIHDTGWHWPNLWASGYDRP
jgi:hypothetical protein